MNKFLIQFRTRIESILDETLSSDFPALSAAERKRQVADMLRTMSANDAVAIYSGQ